MCICDRNWQANDCSERICQFGNAHVDTPKGDLNMDGTISSPDHPKIDNSFVYPYGTTEQFPQMEDSELNELTNSAHYYMECSNGYDGVACQRASCPGFPASCSGHGVCKTKRQLAAADNDNVYQLWDKDATMGCECDDGYDGADCSLRTCKHGIDPLYLDDSATIKYSIFDFATLTTAATPDFTDGTPLAGTGTWAIRFYDIHGEDWLTQPIDAGATCDEVVAALEALPNNVIPSGETTCNKYTGANSVDTTWSTTVTGRTPGNPYTIKYKMALWDATTVIFDESDTHWLGSYDLPGSGIGDTSHSGRSVSGHVYRIKFFGNPGALPQPKIEIKLDGGRPSLASTGKVITKVWTDGQQGEDNDYFADHCDGVTVTIDGSNILAGLSAAQVKLLKACLGASDFDKDNNVDVYNWDYGSASYPHIIKLVRSETVQTDGGYYAALYYTDADGFLLVNPFSPPDGLDTDSYEIYTTTGTLALTSSTSQATFGFASNTIYMANLVYDEVGGTSFNGDISCETGSANAAIAHCLNKTDIFALLAFNVDGTASEYNSPNINLYTATRLYTQKPVLVGAYANLDAYSSTQAVNYMTHILNTDIATNWASPNYATEVFRVYKFFPAVASTYNYVAECSNRGICATDTALCTCFHGYTNDDCSVQNSVAL